MQMPKNYEQTQAYGEIKPLELGGHIMKIVKVEETQSKSGKDMIMIYLDTDKSDKQPQFYKERYDNDTRDNKKWGCIVYQLVNDKDGNTNPGLKTFHTSVAESNNGFVLKWGDDYANQFKNKLIGGVFGRQQFRTNKDELKFSTKCVGFRSVKTIKEGVAIPEDKFLSPDKGGSVVVYNSTVAADMMADTDDDYPF